MTLPLDPLRLDREAIALALQDPAPHNRLRDAVRERAVALLRFALADAERLGRPPAVLDLPLPKSAIDEAAVGLLLCTLQDVAGQELQVRWSAD